MARLDQETILDAVHHLPAEEQLEIARTILSWADTTEAETLARALRHLSAFNAWLRAMPPVASNGASTASLRGIARMENPPDDTTVEQWLDKHRAEQYGR